MIIVREFQVCENVQFLIGLPKLEYISHFIGNKNPKISKKDLLRF